MYKIELDEIPNGCCSCMQWYFKGIRLMLGGTRNIGYASLESESHRIRVTGTNSLYPKIKELGDDKNAIVSLFYQLLADHLTKDPDNFHKLFSRIQGESFESGVRAGRAQVAEGIKELLEIN